MVNNPPDLCEYSRFLDLSDKLDIHHVYPAEYLSQHYPHEKDPLANFVLLTESTNRRLRNLPPREVLRRPDIYREAIQTHAIDLDLFDPEEGEPAEEIASFLAARADQLADMIYEAVGIRAPA